MSTGPAAAPLKASQQVFVCYRREETAAHAGRVYDAMVARYGERNVFMDVEMEPGIDFVERITEVVSGCVALIVVMGPGWGTVEDEDGARRIDDPDDFVRLEVETGLRNGVHVIPALVHGARMPRREDLPPGLQPLARRNALELSDLRWAYDIGRLLTALDERVTDETEVQLQRSDPREEVELNPQPLPPEPPGWPVVPEGMLLAGVVAALGDLLSNLMIPAPAEVKLSEGIPTSAETAERIIGLVLRFGLISALVGLALAIFLSYRLRGVDGFRHWLRGFAVGAAAGLTSGVAWTLPVYLPEKNLPLDERRQIALGTIVIGGGIIGGLIGSLWIPRRIGAALLAGAVGGFLYQLVVVAAKWESPGALGFGLGNAAIAGLALGAMVALDRREAPAPAGEGSRRATGRA